MPPVVAEEAGTLLAPQIEVEVPVVVAVDQRGTLVELDGQAGRFPHIREDTIAVVDVQMARTIEINVSVVVPIGGHGAFGSQSHRQSREAYSRSRGPLFERAVSLVPIQKALVGVDMRVVGREE